MKSYIITAIAALATSAAVPAMADTPAQPDPISSFSKSNQIYIRGILKIADAYQQMEDLLSSVKDKKGADAAAARFQAVHEHIIAAVNFELDDEEDADDDIEADEPEDEEEYDRAQRNYLPIFHAAQERAETKAVELLEMTPSCYGSKALQKVLVDYFAPGYVEVVEEVE